MVGSSQAVLSFPNKSQCKNLLLADLGQDDAVILGNIATDRALTVTGCFKREIAIGIILQNLQVSCIGIGAPFQLPLFMITAQWLSECGSARGLT